MKLKITSALVLASLPAVLSADDSALVSAQGTLLFADDFNRIESTPDKEEVGGGWTTNSKERAKGHKQVTLIDGAMQATKHAEADHAVSIRHDAAFQDGAVQMKFKLGTGEELVIDFADLGLKTVHAGHLFKAAVSLKNVTLTDLKTGLMDLKIQEQVKAGEKSPELTALLKTKAKAFPQDLKAGEWHMLLIVVVGDTMRATVDDVFVGEFKSEGIAHPTKRMLRLAVNKSVWVDDVKVWKLK